MRAFHLSSIVLILLLLVTTTVVAQPNLTGRGFTFTRISFEAWAQSHNPAWQHDHPRAEENLLGLLESEVGLETTPQNWQVLELSDSEILDEPILFLTEPGYWDPGEAEITNLRRYLEGGGILVLDDFRGDEEWARVEEIFSRVLPGRTFEDLTSDDEPFTAYFSLGSTDLLPPYDVPGPPVNRGIKDEAGRLSVVAFYNNDLGDYWEWSDRNAPFNHPELFRKSLEIGVNLVVMALLRQR